MDDVKKVIDLARLKGSTSVDFEPYDTATLVAALDELFSSMEQHITNIIDMTLAESEDDD